MISLPLHHRKSKIFAKLQIQLLDQHKALLDQATPVMGEQKLNITWSEFADSCGRSFARLFEVRKCTKKEVRDHSFKL